ncbi:MAG: peptide-methionine (S)-S-oxide reductase MsrA [Bacteroidota bacterium]
MSSTIETATLGGGCFWCVEAVYDSVEGVISATSGYSGGTAETANYEAVCSKTTDHVEVVQIEFDASVISYAEILEMFWTAHDPTTPNRQGNDVGPQYRSAIFYHNEAQKQIAEDSIANVATKVWDDPIVTELIPSEAFYEAEAYHHNYYEKVGSRNSYCTFVITPKVNKFRRKFAHRLKKQKA